MSAGDMRVNTPGYLCARPSFVYPPRFAKSRPAWAASRSSVVDLFDDFHDAVRPGIDQDRAGIDDRIAIIADAILGGNFIVGHACFRQHRTDADVLAIVIGGVVTFGNIAVEARALVDAQHTGDAADHATDDAADNGSNRTGRPFAFARAMLDAAGHAALCKRGHRRSHDSHETGSGEILTDFHGMSLLWKRAL